MADFNFAFDQFGMGASNEPIRLDPAGYKAWSDSVPNPLAGGKDALKTASDAIGKVASGAGIQGADVASSSNASQSAGVIGGAGGGQLAAYFIRGVVIILGFIFVAVGLTMFKPQAILQKAIS